MINNIHLENATQLSQEEVLNQKLEVEIWDPQLTQSQKDRILSPFSVAVPLKDTVKRDIERMAALDSQEFGDEYGEAVWYLIYNLNSTVCVLRNRETKQIDGFTLTIPAKDAYQLNKMYSSRDDDETVAYVFSTVLAPEVRGQKQVKRLMEALEKELRAKGYKFIDRDAKDIKEPGKKSYADKVVAQAGDRVVHQETHETAIGPQRYIRMTL